MDSPVKFYILSNGMQIASYVVPHGKGSLWVRPMVITVGQPTRNGDVPFNFVPFLPFGSDGASIQIPKDHILASYDADDRYVGMYKKAIENIKSKELERKTGLKIVKSMPNLERN